MTIGQYIKHKQPREYQKLMKLCECKPKKDNLSFNEIDKIMRERTGIDSTRCRGR